MVLWNSVNNMQAEFDTQTRLGQCLYPCPHVVSVHSVGQWCVYTYEGMQALVMHFDPTYVHLHAKVKYSGTPLKRTPLGPKILSFIERCH